MFILAIIAIITIYTMFASASNNGSVTSSKKCHERKEPHSWIYQTTDDAMVCYKCGIKPSYEARDDNS